MTYYIVVTLYVVALTALSTWLLLRKVKPVEKENKDPKLNARPKYFWFGDDYAFTKRELDIGQDRAVKNKEDLK